MADATVTTQIETAGTPLGRILEKLKDHEKTLPAGDEQHGLLAAERAIASVAQQLGPRYSPSRATLEGFQVYHEQEQRPVLRRLQAFAADLPGRIERGEGLVLYGPVGTGKDHLLAALLYRAANLGIVGQWVSGQEIYGLIRDQMDSGGSEAGLLAKLSSPTILAISDPIPPIGDPSAWNVAQLYRLLDRRYRLMRPTWCSLNALSAEDADAKLSAPVFDRLRDGAELVGCFWPSYRERKR